MEPLNRIVDELLEAARAEEHGRAARLLVHDGPLRQTLVALRSGAVLADHNSPPAASMQVLRGRVHVTAQEHDELSEGEIAALTHHRHGVEAQEDSAFLLTTVTGVPGMDSHADGD
ncbi:cupin [Kocuria palustris]|uniref:cupin n=1 Tax=Kocuria palustris TaxID=71999 RepID=UPI0011A45B1B|nr:cupin [Kocuria palustris]